MLAAASSLLHEVIHGVRRPARVIASFDHAVYLRLPGNDVVVPVLDAMALRLPTAVLVNAPLESGVRPRIGATATVGDRQISWPGLHIDVAREWRPAPVRVATSARSNAVLTRGMEHLHHPETPGLVERFGAVLDVLSDVLSDADRCRPSELDLTAAVGQVVGFGPGLTPSGDDALCGALLVLRARSHPAAPDLWGAVVANLHRTTSLSASLLCAANAGHAVPCVVRLVNLLVSDTPDESACAATLSEVLEIGHSSGADLVTGIALTLSSPVFISKGACLV